MTRQDDGQKRGREPRLRTAKHKGGHAHPQDGVKSVHQHGQDGGDKSRTRPETRRSTARSEGSAGARCAVGPVPAVPAYGFANVPSETRLSATAIRL